MTPGSGGEAASGRGIEEVVEECFIAQQAVAALDLGREAAAGDNLHLFRGLPDQPTRPRVVHHGVRQRMVRSLLGRRGHAQQIVFRIVCFGDRGILWVPHPFAFFLAKGWDTTKRMNGSQHRPAHGERSGLVQHNGVQMGQAFQRLAAFEQNAKLRAAAHGNGKRGGHGQSHGAGAGDHQYGDGVGQGQGERVRGDKPRHKGQCRQGQNHGHKDGAGAVGQPFQGRARALRLLDHARDLGKHRGLAQRLRPAYHGAVVVERAGQNPAARLALQRGGFAGEHRLVHGGAALEDRGVHREAFSRQNQHAVAGLYFFERHNGFRAIADAPGGGWAQAGERVERGQGAAFGAAFQAFT